MYLHDPNRQLHEQVAIDRCQGRRWTRDDQEEIRRRKGNHLLRPHGAINFGTENVSRIVSRLITNKYLTVIATQFSSRHS